MVSKILGSRAERKLIRGEGRDNERASRLLRVT